MSKELMITQQDLIDWIDRPPSNDDLDLCNYLSNAVKNQCEYKNELEKIHAIVNNEKISGVEARLMIKDISEGNNENK